MGNNLQGRLGHLGAFTEMTEEGQVAGCGQPNWHTEGPHVLSQRASAGEAMPEPPPALRTGLQIISDAPGKELQLFISRLEVKRYSATPLPFQYLLPSHLFLGLFYPFCPSLSGKVCMRDGSPPAAAQCTQQLLSFSASFHGAEGLEVLQVPRYPGTCKKNACGGGPTLLHHHAGPNCSAVLNSHA